MGAYFDNKTTHNMETVRQIVAKMFSSVRLEQKTFDIITFLKDIFATCFNNLKSPTIKDKITFHKISRLMKHMAHMSNSKNHVQDCNFVRNS